MRNLLELLWVRYRMRRRCDQIRDLRGYLRTGWNSEMNLYMLDLIDRNKIDEGHVAALMRPKQLG
jgi:hypothetical protein